MRVFLAILIMFSLWNMYQIGYYSGYKKVNSKKEKLEKWLKEWKK